MSGNEIATSGSRRLVRRYILRGFHQVASRVTCKIQDANTPLYWDSHLSSICLQIKEDICAVHDWRHHDNTGLQKGRIIQTDILSIMYVTVIARKEVRLSLLTSVCHGDHSAWQLSSSLEYKSFQQPLLVFILYYHLFSVPTLCMTSLY